MSQNQSGRTDDVRFMYIRHAVRPITIAYRFNDEANRVEYNFTRCSEKDQFVKHTGRVKATGRLKAGNSTTVQHPNKFIPYTEVANEHGRPSYKRISARLVKDMEPIMNDDYEWAVGSDGDEELPHW